MVATEYVPIRSMSIYAHGSTSTILASSLSRLPDFLNFRHVLQFLTLSSAYVTDLGWLHTCYIVLANLVDPG